MAGTYTHPYEAGPSVYHQPAVAPIHVAVPMGLPQHPNIVQAVGDPRRGELAGLRGLGQLPAAATIPAPAIPAPALGDDTRLGTGAWATFQLLGATIGGATVGYVASQNPEGATTGALFSGSFAAINSSVVFGREGNQAGSMVLLTTGLGALGLALYRFQQGLSVQMKKRGRL